MSKIHEWMSNDVTQALSSVNEIDRNIHLRSICIKSNLDYKNCKSYEVSNKCEVLAFESYSTFSNKNIKKCHRTSFVRVIVHN